ncbi:hypothetical protein DEF23_08055 [Marinitenerispora sediminis]|uniref:Uncharacterized protein n=1 Tax=Marinitenerispora sediminis TaxID=1931232 RepID=A0A368T4Z9_9ACTN|nr:hypothetical protein DEF24_19845 [Marinitenerispora sediminis]RCV57094.1 hypothetical protein DEF28_02180 [Marinitenerispora sediminis]RCV58911.1 hypothetical protein DEF23_08055 [Marinitenerispora sediminis]
MWTLVTWQSAQATSGRLGADQVEVEKTIARLFVSCCSSRGAVSVGGALDLGVVTEQTVHGPPSALGVVADEAGSGQIGEYLLHILGWHAGKRSSAAGRDVGSRVQCEADKHLSLTLAQFFK